MANAIYVANGLFSVKLLARTICVDSIFQLILLATEWMGSMLSPVPFVHCIEVILMRVIITFRSYHFNKSFASHRFWRKITGIGRTHCVSGITKSFMLMHSISISQNHANISGGISFSFYSELMTCKPLNY